MQNMQFLIGSNDGLSRFSQISPLEIFSSVVLKFWATVSSQLLANPQAKPYPDVVTFAFFCRKAHLLALQKPYAESDMRWGRGVIFHIAPSNVPVNFAYSLLVGMLAGNANVIRVSSKDFVQVDLICHAMREVLENAEFAILRERLCVVKYPRSLEVNQVLSALSDVRVIWGGDATIAEVRQAPLSARAFDVCFADRYSIAVFNAEAVLAHPDMQGLARNFYNDTYLFDQNACSAPRLLVWQGDAIHVAAAQEVFWAAVQSQLDNYSIDAVAAIDKLSTLCTYADDPTGVRLISRSNNKLWRIALERLNSDLTAHRCAAGYFLEYITQDLADLKGVVNRKYQTLAYFGFDPKEMKELLLNSRFVGIDRVVPVGKTTDFSLSWDGHDLIYAFSRVCAVS